jgi:hypothetical protein
MSEISPPSVVECSMVHERIALISLKRREARNAVASPNVWAGVLTGKGQAFCAGADLKEVAAGHIDALSTEAGSAGFVDAPCVKPWIAKSGPPRWSGR